MQEDLKQTSIQRVQLLFKLAKESINKRPDLAKRYVELARKIAMRTRFHLPLECRLLVCRHCKRYILPGTNSRVRVQPRREAHVVITCLYCGGHMRFPLEKK